MTVNNVRGTGPFTPVNRAAAQQAQAPAPAGQTANAQAPRATDALDTAIAMTIGDSEAVDLDNISIEERNALAGMLDNYMQDKRFTSAEQATFKKTLQFYAASPAGPTGGGKTPGVQQLDAAKDKLAGAVASQLTELKELRGLAEGLDFAQGGDVDRLRPNYRKDAFMNNLKKAEQHLLKTPPDVERYRAHLSWARTILNPPAKPLNEAGESRHQKHWGKPVPGAEAALAKLNGLIEKAGHKSDKLTTSLYDLRGDVTEAQSRVDAEKDFAGQQAKVDAKAAEAADFKQKAEVYGAEHKRDHAASAAAIDAFGNDVLIRLATKAGNPAAAEAMKEFSSASNAAKLGHYGSAKQFLDRLGGKLAELGLDGSAIQGLKDKLNTAAASWRKAHNARCDAARTEQEHTRMKAGLEAASPQPTPAPKPAEPAGGGAPAAQPAQPARPEPKPQPEVVGFPFVIGIFPVFPVLLLPVMWDRTNWLGSGAA